MSDNYLIVIPFVDEEQFEACRNSLKLSRENMYPIDNSRYNNGVAGSWNMGIKKMQELSKDWLIIVSSSMRFGEKGGVDMIERLQHNNADILRFAQSHVPETLFNMSTAPSYEEGGFYWHCTAISKFVIQEVGKFDANFHPIYFEDTDYDLRIEKAGIVADYITPIDAKSEGVGLAVKSGKVKSVPTNDLVAYFATKWGRHPGAKHLGSYDTPFNDPTKSIQFWPPANGQVWDE